MGGICLSGSHSAGGGRRIVRRLPGQPRPPSKTDASFKTNQQNEKGSEEVVSFMTYS